MYRLLFSLLWVLPWWMYAALSVTLASSVFGLWTNAQDQTAAAEIAIAQGPPRIQKVDDFDGRLRADRLADVRVAGLIRADLGIGRIEGTVPKSYLVLDGAGQDGVVLAVLFVGSDDQAGLTDLIGTADASGLVIANGFRRVSDRAAIAGQLRLKGIDREVAVIEAIVGDRAAALRGKASTDFYFAYVIGALAVFFGFIAYIRKSRKRKRRAAERPRAAAVQQTARAEAPKPAAPKAHTSRAPWGGPQKAPPNETQAAPEPSRHSERTPDLAPDAPVPIAPFESVFPGGGSGFRFKTADEIIRETFGKVSHLSDPDRNG